MTVWIVVRSLYHQMMGVSLVCSHRKQCEKRARELQAAAKPGFRFDVERYTLDENHPFPDPT